MDAVPIRGSKAGRPAWKRKAIGPPAGVRMPPGAKPSDVGNDFHAALERLAGDQWFQPTQRVLRGERFRYRIGTLFEGIPKPVAAEKDYQFREVLSDGTRRREFSQRGSVDAVLPDGTLVDWKLSFGPWNGKRYRSSLQWLWYLHAFPEAPGFRYVVFGIRWTGGPSFELTWRHDLALARWDGCEQEARRQMLRLAR